MRHTSPLVATWIVFLSFKEMLIQFCTSDDKSLSHCGGGCDVLAIALFRNEELHSPVCESVTSRKPPAASPLLALPWWKKIAPKVTILPGVTHIISNDWSIAFSLFPLGWYSYTFSEVTWFAHCVVKTYATQSSFEPNCLFCIKRDGNHPLANFWPGMPRLTFHLAILLWKSHVKIFLSNAY